MKFSEALEHCMAGARITRADWNGKGMFVYYVEPHNVDIDDWYDQDALTEKEIEDGTVQVAGHFDMYNAQGIRIIGWLASQTDMASDQWEIYETEKEREQRLKEARKLLDELEKDGFFDKEE